MPSVSLLVVCTNELHHLRDLLPSLAVQDYPRCEIVLIDNGSTDGGPEYAEREFPLVRVVRNGANLGYTGANNRGLAASASEVVVVLNPDTRVAPDWLRELVGALQTHPRPAVATPDILMFASSEEVNTQGNDIHLNGMGFCRNLGTRRGSGRADPQVVAAISGCAFAVRRDVVRRIGLFDEDLFMTMEDTDFSLRARLAGLDCIFVPTSRVYHKYGIRLHAQKFFLLERNRMWILLKHFRWRSLAVAAPSLLLTEAFVWAFAASMGRPYLAAKARAYADLAAKRQRIAHSRQALQRLRARTDRDLLALTTWKVPFHQLTSNRLAGRIAAALCGPVFLTNALFAKRVVRW